jgi:hypothetical protein
MNTETGKVYEGDEVAAAKARGEKLVEITQRAAKQIRAGRAALAIARRKNRMAQRRARERKQKRKASTRQGMQKASRRANRSR